MADLQAPASSTTDSNTIHEASPSLTLQSKDLTLPKRPWRRTVTAWQDIAQGKQYRGEGTEEKPFIVNWLDNDPEDPQNYEMWYKWVVTMCVAVATLAVALASSAYSGAVASIIRTFHVSSELTIAGISLFLVGFVLGPLIWAPASESFGRRPVFILTYSLFTVFNAACAGANSMTSLLVFRFLAGAFGSSPLTCAGGTLADMFNAKQRGLAMGVFAACPFLGPALGPICGGFLGEAAGFRWVHGFLAIFSGLLTIIGTLVLPETYAPALLRDRAARLSKVTGLVYRAPQDARQALDIVALFRKSLTMPWKFLFTEVPVIIISIYVAIVYGCLYMLFSAFPIVFQKGRGWSTGIGGLSFLGVLVGMMLSVTYIIFWGNPSYERQAEAAGGRAPPEARLPPGIAGGCFAVIGLAWFTASCGPKVHWIVPILAGVPFGAGMVLVMLSFLNYLVDTYSVYAASVLAANSILRSAFGAAFPLFTGSMYNKLGVHWASAIPTFLLAACRNFLFYTQGSKIRARSKLAVEAEQMLMAYMRPPPTVEKVVEKEQV
ncbi:MFS general substrate transporter [Meredithblackwellia eburnea MCA 4105]